MEYDSAIALAQRLIAKKGQKVTWKQVKNTADPSEPWKQTPTADVSKTVSICFVAVSDNQWRKLLAYLKGTEVPTGRLAGIMGAVNFTPNLKDVVVRSGKELRIESIDVLSPNGQVILYTIEFIE